MDPAHLEAVCKVLGDTASGLTGGEIERLLRARGIADPGPITKWQRLHQAFLAQQTRDRCANNVVAFIADAMAPARYLNSRQVFEIRRAALNVALAFEGLSVRDDGNVERREVAKTLSEAEGRASLLRRALQDRKVHPEVLKFCRAELLEDNYFHAVLEATKSVADRLRGLTGLTEDGSELADKALMLGAAGHPRLALNSCGEESERSEQKGFAWLVKGLFGAFRNPTAHAPRISWTMSEQDALDILSTISYVHRRLDSAVRTHVA